MTRRWVIGLAAGSSGCSLHTALVELEGVGLEIRLLQRFATQQPYAAELRDQIRRVTAQPVEARAVGRLHRLLGETLACAARTVADTAGIPLARVMLIGCPGLTVGHDPEGRFPSALPLGMAAVVAERTGVTVVSDLSARDVAAGGQGTPITALPDYLLFRDSTHTRLLVHLGGMVRLVWLPAGGKVGEIVGFEVGPCGVLLDALIRQLTGNKEQFDSGGRHAVQGKCVDALLDAWLAHPLLQRRPPRGLPRQGFGDEFAKQALEQARRLGASLHDLLCTASHFVVRTLADAVTRYVPTRPAIDQMLLTGGGVRNGLLWRLLAAQWVHLPLLRTDEVGIPAEYRQALSTALLAALTLDGVPGNVPTATGAAGSRLLGSLTPGASANWSRCVQWMAQHVHAG
ncbi:MAG: anhydro-N-acetylmuramic acid kinase [Gemmataceae bacterium]